MIGEASVNGEFTRIVAQKLYSLDQVIDSKATNYTITLSKPVKLEDIKTFLKTHQGGQDKVTIRANVDNKGEPNTININLPGSYNLTPTSVNKLKSLPGISNIKSRFTGL